MAENTTVARPYAQAIFDLARSQSTDGAALKAWSQILKDTVSVVADPQLKSLLGDPRISKGQWEQLVLDVLGPKLPVLAQNFIRLLIENGRLGILPEIAAHYEVQRAEAEGTLQAEVISALPLSPEQTVKISTALQARTGRKVQISNTLDKDLLGGVIIHAGDTVIDGSARGQLAKLASALAR